MVDKKTNELLEIESEEKAQILADIEVLQAEMKLAEALARKEKLELTLKINKIDDDLCRKSCTVSNKVSKLRKLLREYEEKEEKRKTQQGTCPICREKVVDGCWVKCANCGMNVCKSCYDGDMCGVCLDEFYNSRVQYTGLIKHGMVE